jgi:hypothetical protein
MDLAVLERDLASKPPEIRDQIIREAMEATKHLKWIPSPGPQTEAYYSKADVLLFGGEPAGGKSDLLLGLAFNEHQKSLIMRRRYTDLSGIVDRLLEINGGKEGFNGSPPPSLKTGRVSIEMGAASSPGDEQNFQGRPRDFLGIDEATQWQEMQVRFLMGWVRSADPKQRCRVVLATNPPMTSEGLWVLKMFAPWLDDTFPKPARAGELRWVVSDEDGDRWVDGPGYVEVRGKLVKPTSRTYIPSKLKDNPFLRDTGYEATLDALPEEIHAILMGGFRASFKDAPGQMIPTDWIRQAQARWTKTPPQGIPMCAMGVDCSGGGNDPLAIAMRHDAWYAPIIEVPAKQIPKDKPGAHAAGVVIANRRDQAVAVIDLGGGYGEGCYNILRENSIAVRGYKGGEKSNRRTLGKQLPFFNVRSEAYWRFREALDPANNTGIALPADSVLVADLTAPLLDMEYAAKGIKAESKEKVCERLGRSPNRGDAVVMAWYDGPKGIEGDAWSGFMRNMKRMPKVVMGRRR